MLWRKPSSSAPIKKAIHRPESLQALSLTEAFRLGSVARMARHPMTRVTLMTARAGLCAAVLFGSVSIASAACPGPAGFPQWLQGFKQQAIAQGISPGTVNSALNGVTYYPTAIAHDRRQGVFAQDFLTFAGRMVSSNRMQVGSSLLKDRAAIWRSRTGPRRLLGTRNGLRQGDGQTAEHPIARHLELRLPPS
jgi:hypothetical protein